MEKQKEVSAVFDPYGWQLPAMRDTSPIVLLTGAAGGGKSRTGLEKLHALLSFFPNSTGIMGRQDRASAGRSIVPFMQYTVQQNTRWGVFKKGDGLFQYENGSQLWVVGMNGQQQREALKSIGQDGSVDFALFEEANALTEADHNLILSRMRGTAAPFTQVIYMTNPDAPDHWINKRLILGRQASVHYSRPEDNPYNPPTYIDTLKSLTGVYYDRLWLGLWVVAEGAIYPEFEVSKHWLEYAIEDYPKHDRHMVAIDFGYTNPTCVGLFHVDRDDKITLVKEIYRVQQDIDQLIEPIREMIDGYKIERWVCDHDAGDRSILERKLDIETKPAFKDVAVGIANVKRRFRDNQLYLMKGSLQHAEDEILKKLGKPTSTKAEIGGYVWSDKKQDTPVKKNDHGVDTLRYVCAEVDDLSEEIIDADAQVTTENYVYGNMNAFIDDNNDFETAY